MELGQRPELRHKVTLSPQVYQGLSILAMPVAELQVLVEAELLENPVLELEEFEEAPPEEEKEREEAADEERSWDEWLDQYEELDSAEPVVPRDPNVEDVDTDEFVGGVQTFDDYLLQQLGMLDIDDETMHAARAIVGSLDHDGFFCVGLGEIATIAEVGCDVAERALAVSASTSRCCRASSRSISMTLPPTTSARSRGPSKSTRTRCAVSWNCCARSIPGPPGPSRLVRPPATSFRT
jgi:DNA-directed RNA polymerase specialized sigma54-like protein